MSANINNTLLAFLLALKELENPLTDAERRKLFSISEQLATDTSPEIWKNLTEPNLLSLIENNIPLKQDFQKIKTRLDSLSDTIPLNLLPTLEELEQIAPSPKTQPSARIIPDDELNNQANYEISNMVIRATTQILGTSQPDQTVKKLNPLDKLRKYLNSSANNI